MSRCRRRVGVGDRQHQPKAALAKAPPSGSAERIPARPPAPRLLDAYAGTNDLRGPALANAHRRQPDRASPAAQGREHRVGSRDRSRGTKRAGLLGNGNRIGEQPCPPIWIDGATGRVGIFENPGRNEREQRSSQRPKPSPNPALNLYFQRKEPIAQWKS